MERLTNVTDLYLSLRSETREAYLERFLSALQLRIVSKPITFLKLLIFDLILNIQIQISLLLGNLYLTDLVKTKTN